MKHKQQNYIILFILLFTVVLGGVVRFYPVLLSDFPLNDGGLFYTMTLDVLDNNYSLPTYTTYNGSEIPFGYPPFAFYMMAFLQQFFHFGIISQLQFLPAFFSTLCIPAFYFLSRSMTGSRERSAFAVIAFALMPRSYLWLVMGGGITRSLGFLFGILSILFVWEMFRVPKLHYLILSILFCSLTILSHPETAWFVFLTSLIIGLRYGLNKKGTIFAVLTILGVLLLTSIWWIPIIHGSSESVLYNGAQTGSFFSVSSALFYFTGEPFITILAVVALFGLLSELIRQRFFLFIWMIMITILFARSGETFFTIPGSMLFGSGMVWVLIPGLLSYTKMVPEYPQPLAEIMRERISKIALGIILIFSLISAMALPNLGFSQTESLSQDNHQAMEWASQNTLLDSQFAVLTGEKAWENDMISEWFPSISKRISVSTVQGSEWLPDKQFKQQIERNKLLQSCTEMDYSCVSTWANDNNESFSYLYVVKRQVGEVSIQLPIAYSLMKSEHFQLVFDNPGVSIYKTIDFP